MDTEVTDMMTGGLGGENNVDAVREGCSHALWGLGRLAPKHRVFRRKTHSLGRLVHRDRNISVTFTN